MRSEVKNKVFWYENYTPEKTPLLNDDLDIDVAIIGGGMAGLMCAKNLISKGLSISIFEKDFCGSGASGKTSGFITPDSEIELSALIDDYGEERAKEIWEFVLGGVEMIRETIIENKINCDYVVQDSLFVSNSKYSSKYPKEEYISRKRLGYESNLYDKSVIKSIIKSDSFDSGVRYKNTFGINSYIFCQELKKILVRKGVQIFENSKVEEIGQNMLTVNGSKIKAKWIIVCADRFIPEIGSIKKEIYHAQTFLGITNPLPQTEIMKIFKDVNEKMMVWDTDLVYNYFRVTGENRLLIGGGDLLYTYAKKYATNVGRFVHRLTSYIHKKFPDLKFEIEYMWPGMLGISKDLLPVMGFDDKNNSVWYVGAATGLPWAAALGAYAGEKIFRGRSDFDSIFSKDRKFVIGRKIQSVIGDGPTYAISNGISKYL